MTPGARLQSAIGILEDIFRNGRPADRVFDAWARSNRYAGSKDRAAVSELTYAVLRRRAELSAAIGASEVRLLAFAALVLLDELSVAAVVALADGARHAPAPLSQEEQRALSAAVLPGENAQPWVRYNYPEWLHSELDIAFGSELEREMSALMDRAPTDLRANTLKMKREKVQTLLIGEGLSTEPTPWSPWGLRLTSRVNVLGLASFRDGAIEIQDEGSQLACLLAGAAPGEQVVDLCAGGGGKSLALAAMMKNHGQIYACDTDARRLSGLTPRVRRADIRNLQVRTLGPFVPNTPDGDLADLESRADCVFVDAPCSGTGAWRRSPDARWRLNPEMLAGYRATQAEVLARGARLVRPGGRLVYVTCSLLPSENENQIEAFLAAHPAFAPQSWVVNWPEHVPLPPAPPGQWLHLTPASTGTDGFFVAVLRREALS